MSTQRRPRTDRRERRPRERDPEPIWSRPPPGSRRPKLTREQIAELALAIADAEGFEAVSMRRLATELNVGTMTLYYYVRTKDDLIALMDDALMSEVVVPDGELPADWRAALTAIARRTRDVFVRHPWAMRGLEGARIGPNGMRHMEQTLAAVAELPIEPRARLELIAVVDDFVFGYTLRTQDPSLTAGTDRRSFESMIDFTTAQLRTGAYPHLQALMGTDDPLTAFAKFSRWMASEERFERGLAALLDGVEAALPSRPRRPPPPHERMRRRR